MRKYQTEGIVSRIFVSVLCVGGGGRLCTHTHKMEFSLWVAAHTEFEGHCTGGDNMAAHHQCKRHPRKLQFSIQYSSLYTTAITPALVH